MKLLIYKLLHKFKSRISIIVATTLFYIILINMPIPIFNLKQLGSESFYIYLIVWIFILPFLIISTILHLLKTRKKIHIINKKLNKSNYHLCCDICKGLLFWFIVLICPITFGLFLNFNIIMFIVLIILLLILFLIIRFHHDFEYYGSNIKNFINKIKKGI